jgi:NitT/TauT family transport system substrate-binding protein
VNVRTVAVAVTLAAVGAATGCSTTSGASAKSGSTLRLGYFANVTHATALAEVERGTLQQRLGATKLRTQVFNAGPAAVEAIFAGAIDAAYVGPNPAVNAYVKSKGSAIRIVAGATSGGAELVVAPDVTDVAQLKGKTLATPQLGNTQDVALRAWLASKSLPVDARGAGPVTIAPSENATTLQLFKDHKIAGAWVPEPWASRLVVEGGGKVLVDEKDLWPGGRFATTELVVATKFLTAHPDVVRHLLEAHVETTDWINANTAEAKTVVNAALEKLAGKRLAGAVIDRAFTELNVTYDPVAASLQTSADHAAAAGLIKATSLKGIYDLTLLNDVLSKTGKPAVSDGGLGQG